jgi:hypothetical protein
MTVVNSDQHFQKFWRGAVPSGNHRGMDEAQYLPSSAPGTLARARNRAEESPIFHGFSSH